MFGGGGFPKPLTPPPNDAGSQNQCRGSRWVSKSLAFSDLHQQGSRRLPIRE